MKTLKHLLVVAGLAWPHPALAQSAAEIAAQVDQKMNALDEFGQLLNDPDPERALAAMSIMIGHEDPQIARMALQFGLTSTAAPVRRAALKAYFDSAPTLNVYFDGSALEQDDFSYRIGQVGGTVDTSGEGFATIKVGNFDAAKGCYVYQQYPAYCLVTLSESNVGFHMWQKAASMTLNTAGNLEGMVFVERLRPAVPTTIPIRP